MQLQKGKNIMRVLPSVISILVMVMTLVACGGNKNETIPSVTITSTIQTTSTTTTATTAIGQLALKGEGSYDLRCASCHGNIFISSSAPIYLSKYKNASGLLSYISTRMPGGAPGSLNQEEYWEILCYLLVQNHFTAEDTLFNLDTLSQILLKVG